MLKNAGLEFSVQSPDVDEAVLPKESPKKMVERLSYEKARAVARLSLDENCLIIAADTTVVSPRGHVLGKPTDIKDAYKMLSLILGKTHSVFTAYSIIAVQKGKIKKSFLRTVKTKVRMRPLKIDSIQYYLSLNESLDKAGSYAAQGYGMNLIESISGSYTNVIGLPMCELIEDLKKKFKYPCPL